MSTADARVLSVSQLNNYVKMMIDSNPVLSNVWVKGEISNFKCHSTGHLYFSVKDDGGRILAVMFARDAAKLRFRLEDGMKVIIHGRVSVFPRDGNYQLYCASVEPDGVGELYIAYEQLKRRLEAEGLFSPGIKKRLPKIPSSVGIITSPTGAAIRDIINVTGRRFPYAAIKIFPALVQGDGAEADLIRGIRYFSETHSADVVIIGRGGGSIEDLWAFNSEKLAREIRRSSVPVISAVGHETDYTICDFASDMRAPTPSAAAEIAVPDTTELKKKFQNVTSAMCNSLNKQIEGYSEKLRIISENRVIKNPYAYLDDKRNLLLTVSREMTKETNLTVERKKTRFQRFSSLLNALSPLSIISKGYSAVFSESGEVIKSVSQVKNGQNVSFRMSDGTVNAEVKEIIPENKND